MKFHLFNALQAMPTSRTRRVYVVEGEFDTAIAWQAGVKAVGVPGAGQWYEPWCRLFTDADVRVVFDGDDAGQKGADKLVAMLTRYRVGCEAIALPAGRDMTDLWLDGGRELVRNTLRVE